MFPGLHPMAMMSATGITYPGRSGPTNYQPFAPQPYPPMYPSTIPPINPALAADVQVLYNYLINKLIIIKLSIRCLLITLFNCISGNRIFVYTE